MSSGLSALIHQAVTVAATDTAVPRAPVLVPNGDLKQHATISRADQYKGRGKYKHVEALHTKSRPSCLSHESKDVPSFLGFRNLMVLTIVVMNLRLVVENAKKYGLLISFRSKLRGTDWRLGLLLYACTPCHLFVAYVIERMAMESAKAVIGLRKKSDADPNAPETEVDREAFRRTWWRVGTAHAINATLALLITSTTVYYAIANPGIGMISEIHAIIVWLKVMSYAFTNRDLRHAMLYPKAAAPMLPELYSQCPYPQNITFSNLCYFWWAPTLVYQPCYPRTERIRWSFVAKRLGEVVALFVFMWVVCAQYAAPVLHNSLDYITVLDFTSTLERLMKLSTISLIVWLAGFFAIFQSLFNALAEIMRFGDRVFYDDWWNSTSLAGYWSSWNKPVYHFMRRHIYTPLRGRGYSNKVAVLVVFAFSGFLHELAIGVPTHSIMGAGFAGMLLQLPLIELTRWLEQSRSVKGGKVLGNCIFWISFVFFGQPLAAMLYYYKWQQKYGVLSKTQAPATTFWIW